MDFITYTLSALIALSGVVVGSYLANSAPEEVHTIKKYFPLVQMISLVLLFFVLYSYFPFFIVSALLILTFAFFRLFWHRQNVNILDYSVFAVLFPLTSLVAVAHYYVTLILFAFGVFSGALFYVLHTIPSTKKGSKKSTKKDSSLHVAHHKHRGRHHTHDEILSRLFASYAFFLLLACVSYIVSEIFMHLIN
ncbi:hypothetical protein JXA48_01815 [Candidatus Woesearchaeota archaeon]|nr:hypothetical protein [Candidatus Woesearchaeota archaeon]